MSGQDNVARLRPDGLPEPAPALGMSIQVDLGAGRVCTLQSHVASDCSIAELNDLLDKMTQAGDRQRAHYKLEELHRDLAKQEKDKVQCEVDYDQHKKVFSEQQAKRVVDLERQAKTVDDYEKAKRAERGAGRRGPVELKGQDAANVKRLSESVTALKDQIPQADLAYATECGNFEGSLKAHAKTIERTQREIARCEAIVRGGGIAARE